MFQVIGSLHENFFDWKYFFFLFSTGLGYTGAPLPVYKERRTKGHDCKPSATKSGRTFHISTIFDHKDKECGE